MHEVIGHGSGKSDDSLKADPQVTVAWRDNIKQRSWRLKIPRETAFVYPQLVPVLNGGDIADVRLEMNEDLTAQQLRFSRWQFSTGTGH